MTQSGRNPKITRSQSANNIANVHLHAVLNDAALIQSKVDLLIQSSKFQNYKLKVAEQNFIKHKRSNILLRKSGSLDDKLQSMLQSKFSRSKSRINKLNNNPEDVTIILEQKTGKVGEFKNVFQAAAQQRNRLKQRIEDLKKATTHEKNKKNCVSINNSKKMNQVQNSNIRRLKIQQQSRRNQIMIQQQNNFCYRLQCDLQDLRGDIKYTKKCIEEMRQQNEQLSIRVVNLKKQGMDEKKRLDLLKHNESIKYNEMSNSYMVMNQRKQQKALLISRIDSEFSQNS